MISHSVVYTSSVCVLFFNFLFDLNEPVVQMTGVVGSWGHHIEGLGLVSQ